MDSMRSLWIAGVKGVVQLIEPDNASNNLARRALDQRDLWFIMQRAPGQSLGEFIQRKRPDGLDLRDAIELTLNLCGIIQQMHRRSIVHQDLSPDNIMIEWDFPRAPINEAQLTLVNFSQAVNVSSSGDGTVASSIQTWYPAPQATDKTWILTVDPSTVCAILLWLLTQVDPRHENGELPHQPRRDRLIEVMINAIKTSSEQLPFIQW